MGDGWTIGRGSAWQAQQGRSANADGVTAPVTRDRLARFPTGSPGAARSTVGARPSASIVLPAIQGECSLAFGTLYLCGALG